MPNYFELEVRLRDIEPPIRRRFRLRIIAKFSELHLAIRLAFGWTGESLWEFRTPSGQVLAVPAVAGELYVEGEGLPDAGRLKLSEVLKEPGQSCLYVFDLGDEWVHQVTLVGVVHDKATFRQRMIDGARACPVQGQGGVESYHRALAYFETGVDPLGEDPEDVEAWMGDWNPEDFELDEIKAGFDV